jgi:hypothetical protein
MPSGEFAMIIAGTGPTVAACSYLFLYDAGHIHMMADPPIIQSTGYAFRGTLAGNPVTTDVIRRFIYFSTQTEKEVAMDIATDKISIEIQNLKTAVNRLRQFSDNLPALDRNLQRIAASIKMLELNFIDPQKYGQ